MEDRRKPLAKRLTVTRVALALTGLALLAPATAAAEVEWLCHPALESDPCRGDQTTRYVEPDGSSRVGRPAVPANPPIDCFYVYPTVSNQPTPNATKSPDPEIRSIAKFQAQRFSTRCRLFVPLYRQVTTSGVASGNAGAYDTAHVDVREAWFEYLEKHNRGRGFVLIGHSQGSRHLRALIRREIDRNPGVRRRLVSAIIPGANATVAKGRRIGGDFTKIPTCAKAAQTGCAMSWSTFNETPPDDARYGRTDTDPFGNALGNPTGPRLEVMCVNPARLAGDGDALRTLLPTEPFAPGVIALLLVRLYNGPPPTSDTPWLQPQDHYTARCVHSNGSHVLMTAPVGDARELTPSPDESWGLHLVDVNLPLGNLTKLVRVQTKSWVGRRRPLRVDASGFELVSGPCRIRAAVRGSPDLRIRVTLRRRGRFVRRVHRTLDDDGRARVAFTVDRAGRYYVRVRGPGGLPVATSRRLNLDCT